MIELHRIGHSHDQVAINPSLVVTIEAHPDTTLLLATGARMVVAESPEEVVARINAWHERVAAAAMKAHLASRGGGASGPTPLRSG